MLAAIAIGVVAVVAVWAIFLRGPLPTPEPAGAHTPSANALRQLCGDIPLDLGLRVGAIGRAESAVRDDAKALARAGDTTAAQRARTLADALGSLRHALTTNADTASSTLKVQTALAALAC
jgi:hypothetical protein